MKRLFPLFLPVILVIAASCSPGNEGIFASIEREQKVVSLGGMNKYATITSMAELAPLSGTHVYFATGGQSLFTRNYGAVQWNKMTVGGNATTVAVGTVGANGSEKAYAIAGGLVWIYNTGTGSWDAATTINGNLSGIGDTPARLIPIRANDGWTSTELLLVCYQLFNGASGNQPNYSYVYRINESGALSSRLNIGALVPPPQDGTPTLASDVSAAVNIAASSPYSTYYILNQNYLWEIDSTFTTPKLMSVTFPEVAHNYQGLLYLTTPGKLYLSTMSNADSGGSLYASTSITAGTGVAFGRLGSDTSGVTYNGSPVWFTQLLFNNRTGTIWVATYSTTYFQGTGYMEYEMGGAFHKTPLTSTNNYNSTVLPTSAMGVIFADHESTTAPNYFLGTLSQGLWQWSWGGSGSNSTWVQQ